MLNRRLTAPYRQFVVDVEYFAIFDVINELKFKMTKMN
jgi:hypothetical protein